MASYNTYQLPQHTIDYIKKKNATIAIAKYIGEHGTAPENTEQYYAATSEELERWRRFSYAKTVLSGNAPSNQEEPSNEPNEGEEYATFNFNFEGQDRNILGAL